MQIPGNREKTLNNNQKISYFYSSAETNVKNIEEPNLLLSEERLFKLDIINGADSFVIGHKAKTIDIGIINNYQKFVTKNIQIQLMFKSIINNFYVINGSEILVNITQNNYYFIKQKNPEPTTLKFGLGSYTALNNYLNFEKVNYQGKESLYQYLTYNKKKVMKDIEIKLNNQIGKNDIYKNDLYIYQLFLKFVITIIFKIVTPNTDIDK
tara:strand:+ start:212 stop:841 length:630 start_codon:yes stop_codon:yes gene_type:complete